MPPINSFYNDFSDNFTFAHSLSIMFDEASDIQMHGKLNVFVNVWYTGEVKTLTLALQGNTSIQLLKEIIYVTVFNKPNYTIALELENGDSDTVYRALRTVLEEYNVPLSKVIGFVFRWCGHDARDIPWSLHKTSTKHTRTAGCST
jgi:hypothetical protein